MPRTTSQERSADESFVDFLTDSWGPKWVLAKRRTKALAERYPNSRLVTEAEYQERERTWIEQRASARAALGRPLDRETLEGLQQHGLVERFLTWRKTP